ncbi:MAG: Bax inhibitor-1 family protein, partial [Anaerolineales bacterium]|nr:Bax inhibitor-1 family protein [Anaerolineales bacterium]
YAVVNGLTLSVIFLVYQLGTIVLAFGATAVTFAILSVIGYTTKQDLTRWGGILFGALIGLIIAS